jgi:AcrR family transcriptional regulator
MRSRQKVLDVTRAVIEREGYAAVTVARIAQDSGISRQTIHSIFGSREDLVSAAVAGLATELMATVRERLLETTTATDYVAELIICGRAQMREFPLLGGLLRVTHGNPVFDEGMMERARPVAAELLQPLLDREPGLAARRESLTELVTRLSLSCVLFDSPFVSSDDALRSFVNEWLGPALKS